MIIRHFPNRIRYTPSPLGRIVWLSVALLIIATLYQPPTAVAQNAPPDPEASYWQYQAASRITHIEPSDINDDNIAELLLADASGRVDLLTAAGTPLWTHTAAAAPTALTLLRSEPATLPDTTINRAVALAYDNYLAFVDGYGDLQWETTLREVPIPDSLYTNQDAAAERDWQSNYPAHPIAIHPFDQNGDGRDEILVLLESGQLQLFTQSGERLWSFVRNSSPFANAQPQVIVADFNQDGQQEIALGFFNLRRFTQLLLIDPRGRVIWDRPLEGRITALTAVHFHNKRSSHLAVGTNLGQILLYDADGRKSMPRTVNRPVTSLVAVDLPQGAGLAAGTDVGKIVAYTENGRRAWTHYLSPTPDEAVAALQVVANPQTTPDGSPPLAAVSVSSEAGNPAYTISLLGNDGRSLQTISAGDSAGLSRLLDLNNDGVRELLLVRFASLSLTGLGRGVSEIAGDWQLPLYAPPSAYRVVDFDQDGEDEILVGAEDGRIHRLFNNGRSRWILETTGSITHLGILDHAQSADPPDLVVVRNDDRIDLDTNEATLGGIAVYQANSQELWSLDFPVAVTDLLITDLNNRSRDEIMIGTEDGRILALSAGGQLLWETDTQAALDLYQSNLAIICPDGLSPQGSNSAQPPECNSATLPPASQQPAIDKLLFLAKSAANHALIAANSHTLFRLNGLLPPTLLSTFDAPIVNMFAFSRDIAEDQASFIVFLANGAIFGLSENGAPIPDWPAQTTTLSELGLADDAEITAVTNLNSRSSPTYLLHTSTDGLLYLTLENKTPALAWRLEDVRAVTSYTAVSNSDPTAPNLAIGKNDGRVQLLSGVHNGRPRLQTELDTFSPVFGLTNLRRRGEQNADLLVISSNGLVQMFRTQENRPPLLINPTIDTAQGQYSVSISVLDVEEDEVTVHLDIFNPLTNNWQPQETKVANGSQVLFWPLVNLPSDDMASVRYRFRYDDTFHNGTLQPPPGPALERPLLPTAATPILLTGLGLIALLTVTLLVRQVQQPTTRARRFYRRLQQNPHHTLLQLEQRYRHLAGSPDFLLSLASQARQQGDSRVASLADGLFLIADRPLAGLPIITGVLDNPSVQEANWEDLTRWQQTIGTAQALLEAPSITELSLLRPQLEQLLAALDQDDTWVTPMADLLPPLTNLRDSERVEHTEDKLVYLNEAVHLLQQLEREIERYPASIDRSLVMAIGRRWLGLATAQIEELRGRAEIVIELLTKRIISTTSATVAFQIRNVGRAPAENMIARLDETAAYRVHSTPEEIALLPPGRQQQITFTIDPHVETRFRLSLTLAYADRNHADKELAFGDMVHLLPPQRDFAPIPNRYMPGSPLRQDSELFVGREDLFNFITENAGQLAQRNVLILVGQRRTGKTSALLRLGQHLPPGLLPVYIDCQSLGVMPGMPALFRDLAWHIADALAMRDIIIDVPDIDAWQDNPSQHFQREFLPGVHRHLPPETQLLLVFDEFEAFENLVQDGILPPTFFPFLRHLMQHSENLGFVFVGTRRLEEMTADYWSVLFNIALYKKIGYLSNTAATHLITAPVAPTLIYDDLAIDKIMRVTAGHPYFLQLVCYTLVKHANAQQRSYITISDVNAALDEMLRLGEVHFAYLWQRSTHTERALLTAFAHLADEDIMFHPEELLAYLEPYGIHLPPTEVPQALNRLVERDIVREVAQGSATLYEQHVGLVGLWVARHKSLSRLHAASSSESITRPV